MNEWKTIPAEEFDGIFEKIGKDWMLISASDGKYKNTMTASWGGCGILWNKPIAICFIRPQRFTYGLVERTDRLSLSFLGEEYRSALTFCGRNSGRDGDKFLHAGLHCEMTEGVPFPAEAETVLLCRKLYAAPLAAECFIDRSLIPANYQGDDFHKMYICEIEKVLKKDS